MHELQHAIQQKEGFSPGTNVERSRGYYSSLADQMGDQDLANYIKGTDLGKAFYYANPGEVEARNVAFRYANPEYRQYPIRATEDVSSDLLPKLDTDTTMQDLQNVRQWYEGDDYLDVIRSQPAITRNRP